MTPFASVALFKRNGQTTYRPPRKESNTNPTQARKASARHWNAATEPPDKLVKIVIVQVSGPRVEIAERSMGSANRPWVVYHREIAQAFEEPHVAACLGELGIKQDAAPPALPDVLEINGAIYRREI